MSYYVVIHYLVFTTVVNLRLLDVLAGRKDPGGLTGTLLLDGQPIPENFKCMVGYVVQVRDLAVYGSLGL